LRAEPGYFDATRTSGASRSRSAFGFFAVPARFSRGPTFLVVDVIQLRLEHHVGPWWSFVPLGTRRMRLIQRARRFGLPYSRLTLAMSADPTVQAELLHYLNAAD
jgi:hypothetical protein